MNAPQEGLRPQAENKIRSRLMRSNAAQRILLGVGFAAGVFAGVHAAMEGEIGTPEFVALSTSAATGAIGGTERILARRHSTRVIGQYEQDMGADPESYRRITASRPLEDRTIFHASAYSNSYVDRSIPFVNPVFGWATSMLTTDALSQGPLVVQTERPFATALGLGLAGMTVAIGEMERSSHDRIAHSVSAWFDNVDRNVASKGDTHS